MNRKRFTYLRFIPSWSDECGDWVREEAVEGFTAFSTVGALSEEGTAENAPWAGFVGWAFWFTGCDDPVIPTQKWEMYVIITNLKHVLRKKVRILYIKTDKKISPKNQYC